MISTATEQLADARENLDAARDREWENSTCPDARRMVGFWENQVATYEAMPPEEKVPLF